MAITCSNPNTTFPADPALLSWLAGVFPTGAVNPGVNHDAAFTPAGQIISLVGDGPPTDIFFSPISLPPLPACATNITVGIDVTVEVVGFIDLAVALVNIAVPGPGGFLGIVDPGGAPGIYALSIPPTAVGDADYLAGNIRLMFVDGERGILGQAGSVTWSNAVVTVCFDDAACPVSDLETTVTPVAANTVPGQCDGVTLSVVNNGPSDVGSMLATVALGGTSGATDLILTAAPYRPTGFVVNVGPIGGPLVDASTLTYPITFPGGFDVETQDLLSATGSASLITIPTQVCTPPGAAIGSTTTVTVVAVNMSGVDPDAANNTATSTLTVVQPVDDISVTSTPATGASTPSQCHAVAVVASNSGPNTPTDYRTQLVPGGTSGNTDVTVTGVSYSGASAGEIGPIGGPYIDTNLVSFPATFPGGAEVISHPGVGSTQSLNATGTRVLTPTELVAIQSMLDVFAGGAVFAVSTQDYSSAFSGGSADIVLDGPGAVMEEEFLAMTLPPVPPCATGTVTIQGEITVEGIGGTQLDNFVGLGIADTSQTGIAVLLTAVNGVGTPGPIVLTLPPTLVSAAAYQSGSIIAVSGFTESATPSTFRVTAASFSVTYDASTCATTFIDAEVCTPPTATAGQTTTLDASVSITGATDPNPANDTTSATFTVATVVPPGGITVAPTTLNIEAGCGPEAETLVVTNGTGAALDGALVSIVVPAGMTIRSATLVYAGGASGPSTAPSGTFVVGDWPDGGSITVAFEVVAGCTTPGTYAGSVDVSLAGSPIASVPLTIVRA